MEASGGINVNELHGNGRWRDVERSYIVTDARNFAVSILGNVCIIETRSMKEFVSLKSKIYVERELLKEVIENEVITMQGLY